MKARDRVNAAIKGQKTKVMPTAFWMRLPSELLQEGAKSIVEAQLLYINYTRVDMLIVGNEFIPVKPEPIVDSAEWRGLRPMEEYGPRMNDFRNILGRLSFLNRDKYYLAVDIPSVVTMLVYATGHKSYDQALRVLESHLRSRPHIIEDACKIVAKNIDMMIQEATDSGFDGIYFNTYGLEEGAFSKEEYVSYFRSWDMKHLASIRKAGLDAILHPSMGEYEPQRIVGYPIDALNAKITTAEEVEAFRSAFPNTCLMAGIDAATTKLRNGTPEEIKAEMYQAIELLGERYAIVAANAPLSTNNSLDNIKQAVLATRSHSFAQSLKKKADPEESRAKREQEEKNKNEDKIAEAEKKASAKTK